MKTERLNGLGLARFLAFAGMAIVNFKVVMQTPEIIYSGFLTEALILLEGKAAAVFVVLAGVGITLAARNSAQPSFQITMLKRAVFLLAIGLINLSIFDADIIHYYAFYFALGIWLLPLGTMSLLGVTVLIILAFPALNLFLNYDVGWNWKDLSYSGLWTWEGFIRNLFFNGWHPIVPWLGFFSFGVFLAKIDLSLRINAIRLTVTGIMFLAIIPMISVQTISVLTPILGSDLSQMFATSPIPPGPFYMLNGIGAAMFVIGVCLLVPEVAYKNPLMRTLSQTGQQTLTLYFAHILIGMSILETFKLTGTSNHVMALWFALEFVGLSVLFVYFWRKRFKRGPLEELMRRTTG
ncbi:DUF418 domain-containing protein [Maritalea sp.]|uniref:DUF418 domain-containing protein n=1 Tax=Maritalea sp. TaxID=2003361 RepID=UPI003EF33731